MVLKYICVNESYDTPEMHGQVCIGRFAGFCKLLRVDHHWKNHLGLMPGLWGHYYDVVCNVLTTGLVVSV